VSLLRHTIFSSTADFVWRRLLEPGYVLTYSDGDDGTLEVATTSQTELVDDLETRVVEEREYKSGVLTDLSYNYFAISTFTKSVFYFGEDGELPCVCRPRQPPHPAPGPVEQRPS
jgi:hypothetical protein